MLATKLALKCGSAVNVGGGFHHCSGNQGGGFCMFADIQLAIHEAREAWRKKGKTVSDDESEEEGESRQSKATTRSGPEETTSEESVLKVMIVDLDAHQGNGHATDLGKDKDTVCIVDMYNAEIYPNDRAAKAGITVAVELTSGTGDEEYLEK